jgi:hypothetical protein
MTNVECRLTNVELRNSFYFILLLIVICYVHMAPPFSLGHHRRQCLVIRTEVAYRGKFLQIADRICIFMSLV